MTTPEDLSAKLEAEAAKLAETVAYVEDNRDDWFATMPQEFIQNDKDRVALLRAAAQALREQGERVKVPGADERGEFVGDIFFGDPKNSTRGTHRWDGSEWVELPDERVPLMELLAKSRERVKVLEEALSGIFKRLDHPLNGGQHVNYFVRWPEVEAARRAASRDLLLGHARSRAGRGHAPHPRTGASGMRARGQADAAGAEGRSETRGAGGGRESCVMDRSMEAAREKALGMAGNRAERALIGAALALFLDKLRETHHILSSDELMDIRADEREAGYQSAAGD